MHVKINLENLKSRDVLLRDRSTLARHLIWKDLSWVLRESRFRCVSLLLHFLLIRYPFDLSILRVFFPRWSPISLFCTFRPMLQSRSLSEYEIFLQFFLDRPTTAFPLLISRSVLRGKRIRPSLNYFAIRSAEAPTLQRICIQMPCKKDLLAKTRLRIKGREGLQTVRTKCTLFYVNPAIQILCKAIVNKILDVAEPELTRCDSGKEISKR